MPDPPSSFVDPTPTDHEPPDHLGAAVYRLGDFELSTRPLRLLRDSGDGPEEVTIQPQPARALELLAEREGGLVTRDDLRERLWGLDTHLDHEQAINFTIRKVRAALGDSAQRPRYVETLPRQGYRLVVPVERRDAEPPPSSVAPPSPQRSRQRGVSQAVRGRGWIVGGLIAVVIGAGVVWTLHEPSAPIASAVSSPAQNETLWRIRALIDRGDDASIAEARELLEAQLLDDPDSADIALGMAQWWMADGAADPPLGKRFDTYWPEVERWADRARARDASLADAHVLAAAARLYWRDDPEAARRILEDDALRLDAEHSRGLHLYGLVLASLGDFDAAISVIRQAIALDPENLYVESDLALTYLLARRWDEAIDQARHTIEMGSTDGWWLLLEAQDLAGRHEDAEATAIELTRALHDFETDSLDMLRRLSFEALTRQIPEGDPRHPAFARWAVQVGKDEVAIEALLAACTGPGDWDRPFIGIHPRFDALREHPRWAEVAECVGVGDKAS